MTWFRRSVALVLLAVVSGCGSSEPAPSAEAPSPLTVGQWKGLPADTKFEIETLDRLRHSNPKLMNQREWDQFTRTVVLPAKKAAKK